LFISNAEQNLSDLQSFYFWMLIVNFTGFDLTIIY